MPPGKEFTFSRPTRAGGQQATAKAASLVQGRELAGAALLPTAPGFPGLWEPF